MEFPIKKLSFSKALEEPPTVAVATTTTSTTEEEEEEADTKQSETTNDSDTTTRSALEVLLRIRPLTSKESESQNNVPCIVPNDEDPCLVRVEPPESSRAFRNDQKIENFSFTHVFGPETPQNEIFEKNIQDRVDAMFEERSSLVMSYGITNAGKSYTILGNEENPGIIPSALRRIFNRLNKANEDEENNSFRWRVEVSYIEIYNQQVHDLLKKPKKFMGVTMSRPNLKIRNNKGYVYVDKSVSLPVESADHGMETLHQGAKQRTIKSTKLNSGSSRSHSIFTVKLFREEEEQSKKKKKKKTKISDPKRRPFAELSVVDLAGSERMRRTKNRGQRVRTVGEHLSLSLSHTHTHTYIQVREASNINKSLSTMMRCIRAMLEQQQPAKKGHLVPKVPFRESKLTQLLQQHLQPTRLKGTPEEMQALAAGSSSSLISDGVVFIVNVSSTADDLDETLHVLRHSAVARQIEMRPILVEAVPAAKNVPEYDLNGRRVVSKDESDDEEEEEKEEEEEEEEEEQTEEKEESMEVVVEEENKGEEEDVTPPGEHPRAAAAFATTRPRQERKKKVTEASVPVANLAQIRSLEHENFQLRQALRLHATNRGDLESEIREEVSKEMAQAIEDERVRFQKELDMQRELFAKKTEKMKSLWKKRTREGNMMNRDMLQECEEEIQRVRKKARPSDSSVDTVTESNDEDDRYEVLNAALQSLQQRFTALQHHDDELGNALRAAQFKFESMSRDYKEKCLQIETLDVKLEELTKQNMELSQNLEASSVDVARQVEELKMSRKRIADLESQLKCLHERLANIASKQQFDDEDVKTKTRRTSKRRKNSRKRKASQKVVEKDEEKEKEEDKKESEESPTKRQKYDDEENSKPLTENETKSRNFVAAMKKTQPPRRRSRRNSTKTKKSLPAKTPLRSVPHTRSRGAPKEINAAHTCWHVGTHRPYAAQ